MAKAPTYDVWWKAVNEGKLAVVQAGLDAGIDPNNRDAPSWVKGKTDPPLARAMVSGRGHKVALLLLERGANPNAPDRDGMTPLMSAALYADVPLIEALVKAGADPSAKLVKVGHSLMVEDGSTPYEIALAEGNKKAAQLLQTLAGGKAPAKASPFEKKLTALRAAAFLAIDFEGSEDPVEEALVGFDRPECFQTIGKSGSESIFAFWIAKPGTPADKAPIVYLDSEGVRQVAVAKSLDEFLSILPYGTGTLYDVMSNPKRKLDAKKALADAGGAEEEVDDQPFLKWWKSTFGVAPAKDPAAVLAGAAKETKAFQAWLKEQA